jgi:glucan phosphoethanolaminetransferase (alkaline phosphatase superfamily)
LPLRLITALVPEELSVNQQYNLAHTEYCGMKIILAIVLIVLLAMGVILISRWWFREIKSENIRLFMIMFMGFAIFLKVDIILSYFIESPAVPSPAVRVPL